MAEQSLAQNVHTCVNIEQVMHGAFWQRYEEYTSNYQDGAELTFCYDFRVLAISVSDTARNGGLLG